MLKGKESTKKWVTDETKTANLGDARLNRRFGNILEMLSRQPTASIPAASKGWHETKAAYRFFDYPQVTEETVLQPHIDATIERMRSEPVILLPQDTTELDYSDKPQTQGLGKLSYVKQLGMLLHPTLAVTPNRICLGIVNLEILIREEFKRSSYLQLIISFLIDENPSYKKLCLCLDIAKALKKEALPIEKKESMRWLNSYRKAQELAEQLPESKIVNIADREGDLYEIFVEAQLAKGNGRAEFIIRGNYDRLLADEGEERERKKIKKTVKSSPVVGIVEFDLPQTKDRKARRVTQEIRAVTVSLKSPKRVGIKLPVVTINVVFAREINAPHDVEPIEWMLLTSLPIDTADRAIEIISWYLCRWQIEIFFKILKSGCEVEELQLQTVNRLKPCISLYMIIAWRILYMTMLGRNCPDMPCTAVFENEEWHAVYRVTYRRSPPKVPPDLNSMIKMIAGLGGFLNRKGDGFPGPKPIWIGLQRTRDFVIAMEALDASRS